MNKSVFLGAVIAVLLIITHSQASAQDVFKWIDENGVVHYGQSVPAGVENYERVNITPSPAAPTPPQPQAADRPEPSEPEPAFPTPASSAPAAALQPASAMSLEELDRICEDARERAIAPLRAAAIEECEAAPRRSDPEYCERFHATFGEAARIANGATKPRMFNELPECVQAEQERRNRSSR
jgi:hypothetical protein